jgi:hypothetical protein
VNLRDVIKKLEDRLPMLAGHDADFVMGCKLNVEEGYPVEAPAQARLHKLLVTALAVEPDFDDVANTEKPLSLMDMLNQLAGVGSILTQTERRLVLDWANKLQAGQELTMNEVQALFNLHTAKVV